MELTRQQEQEITGYAEALQDLLMKLTGENGCMKSYDPVEFWEGKLHSYAFDMKDGGRHHSLEYYNSVDDIKRTMLSKVLQEIKDELEI